MTLRSVFLSIAAVAILAAAHSHSYAQARTSTKTQVISVDALGLFQDGNLITGQYEWKASSVNSWFIRAIFGSYTSLYTGIGVGGGYRFFLADNRALTGLSAGPVAHAFFWNASSISKSTTVFTIGGEVQYKWIFDEFSVEPALGVQLGFGGDGVSFQTKTRPYGMVNLGYAF